MKKLLIGLSLLALTATANANDFFGGNDGEWKMGPNGPYYEESDWPEWTPMYWMDEMMNSFDDEEDYGGGNGFMGGMPFMGNNNNFPMMGGNNNFPMMGGGAPMGYGAPMPMQPMAMPMQPMQPMAMPMQPMQPMPMPMQSMPQMTVPAAPGATPGPTAN